MAQQKPLMLKEYLELEFSAESARWAPLQRAGGGGTTVRRLLETELRGTGGGSSGGLLRSRSTGALTRLLAAIRAVGGGGGVFSGVFSKRLTRSFRKKSGDEEEKEGRVLVKDIVRLRSFDHVEPASMERDSSFLCTSPVVSRLSCSSDAGDSTGFDDAEEIGDFSVDGAKSQMSPRSRRSCLIPKPIPSHSPQNAISVSFADASRRPSTCSREAEEMCGKDVLEEEKEQLSPVSIMDFPYLDDDDEEEHQLSPASPSFQQFISNIERSKNQLLQQIRRFESLAHELDSVDLDHQFAGTESTAHVAADEEGEQCESEEVRERRSTTGSLLPRLTGGESLQASGERLLFDFFVEGLAEDQRRRLKSGDEEMLRAARGWVAGWGGVVTEHGEGVESVWEMEMSGGWRRFEEEEAVVAAEMASGLVAWVMEELMDELVPEA